jgi:hypothetical protein
MENVVFNGPAAQPLKVRMKLAGAKPRIQKRVRFQEGVKTYSRVVPHKLVPVPRLFCPSCFNGYHLSATWILCLEGSLCPECCCLDCRSRKTHLGHCTWCNVDPA